MCFRCKLTDTATVSCIIRGLPLSLQANARAYQCDRPEDLYEGFLCALDDYQPPSMTTRPPNREINTRPPAEKKTNPINPDVDPCPRCKKTGHILRNCPYPDSRTCFKCGKQGHIAPRCIATNPVKPPTRNDGNMKEIKLLQNFNQTYEKVAKVNGIHVKSYLDTGSQVNVLSRHISNLLNLKVTPTNTILKGFSGDHVSSCGEVAFQLEIDGIVMHCEAHLTDVDMGNINLLIGQPIINSDGMIMEVNSGIATLKRDTNFMKQFDVTEERTRFKVVTTCKECLLPGPSIIKVHIVGNSDDKDVVTRPQHYELSSTSNSIPATLLRGSTGYIKIVNTGTGNIIWQQGEVLTRAESCDATTSSDAQVSQRANIILPLPLKPLITATYRPPNVVSSVLHTSLASISTIGGVDVNKIKTGPLNKNDYDSLISLLSDYNDCFASNTKELGCTDLIQMKIKLTNTQPIYRHPYRMAHSEQEIVKSKVSELLDAGIVKESESSFASPVILVKKKNGDYRLCVDYRALNAITIKDRFPLPHIDDQISKLAGKKLFTTLDLSQGYHQLKISPEDTHKTAFVTPQGHFEYTRVPFGLANAPSVFMRVMNKIVDSINNDNSAGNSKTVTKMTDTDSFNLPNKYEVLAFLDDLLLPSSDVASGFEILEKVLSKLRSENLKLNMSKCEFLQNKITYLGHEISSDGIQPGEAKLTAVSHFPAPTNLHEVRQFLGLCSYFRKFIKNFAVIARPLSDLTKKKTLFGFGEVISVTVLMN